MSDPRRRPQALAFALALACVVGATPSAAHAAPPDTRDVLVVANRALADNGYPGMSAAVRPMVLSPDERFAYL